DVQQAHIQAKLAVASDGVRQFNIVLTGLIALLRQSPIEALTHLEAIHPTPSFYRVWHIWAMGWAHSQLGETDKLYQQIHQLMPLTRHFNTDLFAFITLWLCGKWASQTRGDNALLAELATHPISHYGIFEIDHAGTFLGTLQDKLERIAPQFEVTVLPPSAPVTPLSDRETEILLLVAQDYSNQAIAEACHLTVGTVKVHLHRIYQKLGVENRSQAVRLAQSQRLLPLS
ncbi:MAG TPA: helix-turn-helix transcriptional regulator, partial [Aggregatilineales bacterium]|nr:helix-turn-helix transcriptional regulator [Aggregatilineales bacterium]